ncbi:helix-hairpin-helix domain-containing protein [Pectinatus brassicae]|uniref:Competence protein ComEA n=1 Tax=Pectinatus brassicae TaxID=862415 RepID=A0A840UDT2_9FIRM|nr:helix-hairpin-helix domain-containing protein [Pectinatus brassicae]MBB5335266.1 competence protein ComEA [Pectinatus brassicae]
MPIFRKQLLIVLIIIAIAIISIIYQITSTPAISLHPNPAAANTITESKPNIIIYVCGAVNNPGVIELPADSRLADAVKKCGGLSAAAAAEKTNLSQKLHDEMQIIIPAKNNIAIADNSRKENSSDKISINNADSTALIKLPGIGPAMAQRIIEYRQKTGAFKTIDELQKVRGIGTAKFTALKDKVCL